LDEEVLELRRRVLGSENPDTLVRIGQSCSRLFSSRSAPQSLGAPRTHSSVRSRFLGPNHPDTINKEPQPQSILDKSKHFFAIFWT
ncbi:hypothetical protein DL96DRAFT_1479862, partial [Flagelloscypha sp. PMI_526]